MISECDRLSLTGEVTSVWNRASFLIIPDLSIIFLLADWIIILNVIGLLPNLPQFRVLKNAGG